MASWEKEHWSPEVRLIRRGSQKTSARGPEASLSPAATASPPPQLSSFLPHLPHAPQEWFEQTNAMLNEEHMSCMYLKSISLPSAQSSQEVSSFLLSHLRDEQMAEVLIEE